MQPHEHACPACGRVFRFATDYPAIRVLKFERLPVPEAIDEMSPVATERAILRGRPDPVSGDPMIAGINMTPEISRACDSPLVAQYLHFLSGLADKEITPQQLRPPLEPDPHFTFAHRLPDTRLYLTLTEAGLAGSNQRVAEIQVLCDGPHLGPDSGRTLQPLGAIARLDYEGLLTIAFRQ